MKRGFLLLFLFLPVLVFGQEMGSQTFHRINVQGTWWETIYEDGIGGSPGSGELDEAEMLWQYHYTGPTCNSTAIGAEGWVAVGTQMNNPTADFFDAWGDGTPEFSLSYHDNIRVAGCPNSTFFAVIHQENIEEVTHQFIAVHDAASESPEEPVWQEEFTNWASSADPSVIMSLDGSTMAVGMANIAAQLYYIKVYSVSSGDLICTLPENGSGTFFREIRITDDGSLIAAVNGAEVVVYETDTGNERSRINMGASNDAFDISGDGSIWAYGWTDVDVYQWNESTQSYTYLTEISGQGYCGEVGISGDGSTIATGWYTTSYNQNVIRIYDTNLETELWNYTYPVTSGPYQDIPSAMALSTDGRWIAMASWGDTDSDREVCIFDREVPGEPYFTVNTPGSVFALTLSADGNLALSCGKGVHANEMGRDGDAFMVYLDVPDFPGEGRWVYMAGGDFSVAARANLDREIVDTLDIMQFPNSVALSSTGREAFFCGIDDTYPEAMYEFETMTGESGFLTDYGYFDVAVSPGDSLIYAVGLDGITIYNRNMQTVINSYSMNNEVGRSVAVGPDGSVVAANDDGALYYAPEGDFEQWSEIYNGAALLPEISLSFHPSGRTIYAAHDITLIEYRDGEIIESMWPESIGIVTILPTWDGNGLIMEEFMYVAYGSRLRYLVTELDGFITDATWDIAELGTSEPGATFKRLGLSQDCEFLVSLAGADNDILYSIDLVDNEITDTLMLEGNTSSIVLDTRGNATPEYTILPSNRVMFLNIPINEEALAAVTVSNTGGGYLWLDRFIENELMDEFSIDNGDLLPMVLQNGWEQDFVFRFVAEQAGAYIDTVYLRTSDGEHHMIQLVGQAVDVSTPENDPTLPDEFAVTGPFPNPFNPSGLLQIALPEAADVRWAVYDVLGREVVSGILPQMIAGYHTLSLDATTWASGIYLWRVQDNHGNLSTGKAVVVK